MSRKKNSRDMGVFSNRLGEGAEALSRHYGGLCGDFGKFFPTFPLPAGSNIVSLPLFLPKK
jgi:hypothetical protein